MAELSGLPDAERATVVAEAGLAIRAAPPLRRTGRIPYSQHLLKQLADAHGRKETR